MSAPPPASTAAAPAAPAAGSTAAAPAAPAAPAAGSTAAAGTTAASGSAPGGSTAPAAPAASTAPTINIANATVTINSEEKKKEAPKPAAKPKEGLNVDLFVHEVNGLANRFCHKVPKPIATVELIQGKTRKLVGVTDEPEGRGFNTVFYRKNKKGVQPFKLEQVRVGDQIVITIYDSSSYYRGDKERGNLGMASIQGEVVVGRAYCNNGKPSRLDLHLKSQTQFSVSGHVLVELASDKKDDGLHDFHDKSVADTLHALTITAGNMEKLISPQRANEQPPMAIVRGLHALAHQIRQQMQSLHILQQQYTPGGFEKQWPDVLQLPNRGFEARPLAYRTVAGKDLPP